jgi:membrane protease YdiL (CAAX protease family)
MRIRESRKRRLCRPRRPRGHRARPTARSSDSADSERTRFDFSRPKTCASELHVVRSRRVALATFIRKSAADVTSRAAVWFWITFAITIVFQAIRLGQDSPERWLTVDYAMRVTTLGLLALSPMCAAVFRREPLRVTFVQFVARLLTTGAAVILTVLIAWKLSSILPDQRLGWYPRATGWLYLFDLTCGIALVAIHEELIFRRLARLAFNWLGDGLAMIATTSLVFAAYHWWTGPSNILAAALVGAILMVLYRAVGAIWPAVLAHYCLDLYLFA